MEVSKSTDFTTIQQAYVASQPTVMEWTNNTAFYALYPTYYFSFANRWLRRWLGWYDGYVWGLHDGTGGLLSTRIGTTLVKRLTQQVYGGGLLFAMQDDNKDGRNALDKIEYWSRMNDFAGKVRTAIEFAGAGGTSAIKLNVSKSKKIEIKNDIWVDVYRADQMYLDIDYRGNVTKARFLINRYTRTVPSTKKDENFYIVEDRYYAKNELGEEKPFAEYRVFRLSGDVVTLDVPIDLGRSLTWAELPKDIIKAIQTEYGVLELSKPKLLEFTNLGVEAIKWTDFVSNLPQLQYGESLLAPIQTYLYLYDYMYSCFNTDLYLGRGRVFVPKSLQNPKNRNNTNYNSGLDSFLFTKVDTTNNEYNKLIEAMQFELRSNDWVTTRNNLLESMATAIGISPSTIASYLNDTSARTAREISSEESSTALYVETKRDLVKAPINRVIDTVLHYYGYGDDVTIKFSKAGQTNQTVLIENVIKKLQAGLISKYSALQELNPDISDSQRQIEYKRILQDEKNKQEQQQSELFGKLNYNDEDGDFVNVQENSDGEEAGVELASTNTRGSTDKDKIND